MGNCCYAEAPCASVEEKSGLLSGKPSAAPETGIEGSFLDSPTSDGRKSSMDVIKEEELKKEQIKAEEKTSVAVQVRQGEDGGQQEQNGVVQKTSVCADAVAPPPRHQSVPVGLPPEPAAEAAPDVTVMGTVAGATPEKPTAAAAVAKEKCPPLSASQEVTDAHCDITSPAADPEGEWRSSQDPCKDTSPKFTPPAPGGSSPPKISNTESVSQPPPSPPQSPSPRSRAMLSEGESAGGSPSPVLQVCGKGPVGSVANEDCSMEVCSMEVCPMEDCPKEECPMDCGTPLSLTVHDSSPVPVSPGPTCDRPSEAVGPETPSQRSLTTVVVEEAKLHSDLPTALRASDQTLENLSGEDSRSQPSSSLESRLLSGPLPLKTHEDLKEEVVDIEQEAVGKGGSKEVEEATGQVMGDRGASIEKAETGMRGEGEDTAAAAGDDVKEEMYVEMKVKAGEEEKEAEEEEEMEVMEEQEKQEKQEKQVEESDEDIYTSKEDMYSSPSSPEFTPLKLEESCSLAPVVDLLSYSQREWRGNTTKSALIRKGYQQMMEWFGGVRRVRGDNYCALRATLFQVLSQTTQSPAWLHQDHFTMVPEELDGSDGLLSLWSFPGEGQAGDGQRDATQRLKGYIELLRKTWASAADCPTAEERRRLCEGVFQGGQEELGLMEALKLLMLGRAAELHRSMGRGQDVPVFCWLLFARDSSPCPRTFLTNHLRQVGVSGGLEQVEMFLLGYALRCTIQVYRLYMSGTEEFLTYYPDDHRDDWPAVSLVTEDDRHYNVPVVTATAAPEAASR